MNNDMITTLGKTGVRVSRIALGCGFRGLFDQKDAEKVIRHAICSGINFLDCSNIYELRDGSRAEKALGAATQDCRESLVITTKYGAIRNPDHSLRRYIDASRKNMISSVEESLKRLGTDYIDVLFLHMPDNQTDFEELAFGFEMLIRQGKIRYAGLCNHKSGQIAMLHGIEKQLGFPTISVIQNPYNLLNRSIEDEILPVCDSLNIGVMAYSPVAAGLLAGDFAEGRTIPEKSVWSYNPVYAKYWEKCKYGSMGKVVNTVAEMAKDYSVSSAVLASAWVLHNKTVTSMISGSDTVEELNEAIQAVNLTLNEADIAVLDRLSVDLREEFTIPAMRKKDII